MDESQSAPMAFCMILCQFPTPTLSKCFGNENYHVGLCVPHNFKELSKRPSAEILLKHCQLYAKTKYLKLLVKGKINNSCGFSGFYFLTHSYMLKPTIPHFDDLYLWDVVAYKKKPSHLFKGSVGLLIHIVSERNGWALRKNGLWSCPVVGCLRVSIPTKG